MIEDDIKNIKNTRLHKDKILKYIEPELDQINSLIKLFDLKMDPTVVVYSDFACILYKANFVNKMVAFVIQINYERETAFYYIEFYGPNFQWKSRHCKHMSELYNQLNTFINEE